MKTVVVNIKRGDAYDIFIGRPSKWGNPFRVGFDKVTGRVLSREDAVNLYRAWIKTQPNILADLHELEGKRLGCYCKPAKCHGDILVELLNKLKSKRRGSYARVAK